MSRQGDEIGGEDGFDQFIADQDNDGGDDMGDMNGAGGAGKGEFKNILDGLTENRAERMRILLNNLP